MKNIKKIGDLNPTEINDLLADQTIRKQIITITRLIFDFHAKRILRGEKNNNLPPRNFQPLCDQLKMSLKRKNFMVDTDNDAFYSHIIMELNKRMIQI